MFCTALSSVFSSHNNFHSHWQRSNHQIKIQLENIILYILISNSNLLEWEEKHGKCLELSFHYFQQLKSFDALNLFNSVNSGNHLADRGMEPNINIMLDLDKWSDSSQPLSLAILLLVAFKLMQDLHAFIHIFSKYSRHSGIKLHGSHGKKSELISTKNS